MCHEIIANKPEHLRASRVDGDAHTRFATVISRKEGERRNVGILLAVAIIVDEVGLVIGDNARIFIHEAVEVVVFFVENFLVDATVAVVVEMVAKLIKQDGVTHAGNDAIEVLAGLFIRGSGIGAATASACGPTDQTGQL